MDIINPRELFLMSDSIIKRYTYEWGAMICSPTTYFVLGDAINTILMCPTTTTSGRVFVSLDEFFEDNIIHEFMQRGSILIITRSGVWLSWCEVAPIGGGGLNHCYHADADSLTFLGRLSTPSS